MGLVISRNYYGFIKEETMMKNENEVFYEIERFKVHLNGSKISDDIIYAFGGEPLEIRQEAIDILQAWITSPELRELPYEFIYEVRLVLWRPGSPRSIPIITEDWHQSLGGLNEEALAFAEHSRQDVSLALMEESEGFHEAAESLKGYWDEADSIGGSEYRILADNSREVLTTLASLIRRYDDNYIFDEEYRSKRYGKLDLFFQEIGKWPTNIPSINVADYPKDDSVLIDLPF